MQHKTIDISVESRLSIQIFEQNTLPYLTKEEITAKLIGLNGQYESYRQSMVKPQARSLEGDYKDRHLTFINQAPKIPEDNAKKLLIQLMYLNVGIKTADECLREGLGIN